MLQLTGLHGQHQPLPVVDLNVEDVQLGNVENCIGPGAPARTRTTHKVGHRRGFRTVAWSLPILKAPTPLAHDQHATTGNTPSMLRSEEPVCLMPASPYPNPDRVTVRIATPDAPGIPPNHSYLLEFSPLQSDEAIAAAVLSDLKTLIEPSDIGVPPPNHTLKIEMTELSWGGSGALLEILIELQPLAEGVAGALIVDAIKSSLRTIAKRGRKPLVDFNEDDAIYQARRQVSVIYDENYNDLSISSIEHNRSAETWTVQLRGLAGARYEVEVGFVDGLPTTSRVKFERP